MTAIEVNFSVLHRHNSLSILAVAAIRLQVIFWEANSASLNSMLLYAEPGFSRAYYASYLTICFLLMVYLPSEDWQKSLT